MPTDLSNNPALTNFYVYGNSLITGTMPTDLTNNSNLKEFRIYSNPLITG